MSTAREQQDKFDTWMVMNGYYQIDRCWLIDGLHVGGKKLRKLLTEYRKSN